MSKLNFVKERHRGRTGIVLATLAVVLSSCSTAFGGYKGVTTQGQSEASLYQGFMITGIVVAGITFLGLFYVLVRFRRRKGTNRIPAQRHSNLPVEVIYTVIPVLIVIGLFVFTVRSENKITQVSSNPNVSVDITAFQWGWRFTYSNGVSIVSQGANYPQLVLPANETTKVTLVSQDVVHGFYVPAFNFSRYALPGVTNYFDLTPTSTGTYVGRCSALCGLYHGEMLFSVRVVTPSQFQSWLTQQKAA